MTPPNDPLAEQIAATVAQHRAEDDAARVAVAVPLPGPLRDAFALVQDIPVGRWNVRPFYDLDIQILQQLNHPLAEVMRDGMAGVETKAIYTPRGPDAWILAWILTRPPKEALRGIKDGTAAEKAMDEFGMLQIAGLLALSEAIMRQVAQYSSTIVNYGPPETEGENGAHPSSAVR